MVSGRVEKYESASVGKGQHSPSTRDRPHRSPQLRLAHLIELNIEYLAELESRDNGKPVAVAKAVDLHFALKVLRYYAGWADKVTGKTVPIGTSLFLSPSLSSSDSHLISSHLSLSLSLSLPISVDGDFFAYTRHEYVCTFKYEPYEKDIETHTLILVPTGQSACAGPSSRGTFQLSQLCEFNANRKISFEKWKLIPADSLPALPPLPALCTLHPALPPPSLPRTWDRWKWGYV